MASRGRSLEHGLGVLKPRKFPDSSFPTRSSHNAAPAWSTDSEFSKCAHGVRPILRPKRLANSGITPSDRLRQTPSSPPQQGAPPRSETDLFRGCHEGRSPCSRTHPRPGSVAVSPSYERRATAFYRAAVDARLKGGSLDTSRPRTRRSYFRLVRAAIPWGGVS